MEFTIRIPDIRPRLSRSIGAFHLPTALITAAALILAWGVVSLIVPSMSTVGAPLVAA